MFIGPALVFLIVFQIYPAINTIILSLLDRRSEAFVGLQNYVYALTSPAMLKALTNNLLWLVIFTSGTVLLGLILAVLMDRIKYEKIAKSIIFMPMVISFVGAGVIWKFMYDYKPLGVDQIGLLNQVRELFRLGPIAWLIESPINKYALIFVGIWIWTGFCMMLLSAAYKGIPTELIEAGRIDGANEIQLFWRIIVPYISPAIIVAVTTMMINVLKIFDIVYVMTNGNYGTEVIANRMFKEMFQFGNTGRASAIAVILFVMILPVTYFNIRRKLKGESS